MKVKVDDAGFTKLKRKVDSINNSIIIEYVDSPARTLSSALRKSMIR